MNVNNSLQKRQEGVYEEGFQEGWRAEYAEAPETGLWTAAIYKHDMSQWHGHAYASLEEARQAAHEHYDRL